MKGNELKMKRGTILAALTASLVAFAPSANAQVAATVNVGASTGDYGSNRSTDMVNAAAGLRWTSGDTSVQVTLPYISIWTPGVVFAGFDGTPLVMLPDAGGPKRRYSGVGDPTLSLSRSASLGSVRLTGTGRVKIPVQGYNDISTGKVDWSVGLQAAVPVGAVTPFAAVSWRSFGDPVGWRIRDGIATSVGASAKVGPGSAAVSWEHARSTSRFVRDADEIVAVYDAPVSDRLRLAAYGTAGVTSGAPGVGGGLRISLRL